MLFFSALIMKIVKIQFCWWLHTSKQHGFLSAGRKEAKAQAMSGDGGDPVCTQVKLCPAARGVLVVGSAVHVG